MTDGGSAIPEVHALLRVLAAGRDVLELGSAFRLTEVGGFVVKDDLTPGRAVDGDPVRTFLLRDPRVVGAELLTTPSTSAIVAVRIA